MRRTAFHLGVLALCGTAAACGLAIVGDGGPDGATAPEAGAGSGDGNEPDGAGVGPDPSAPDGAADADAGWRPTPVPWLAAKTALSFEPSMKQYVNVPNIPIPADFTLEVWVKPSSLGLESMIVSEEMFAVTQDDQFRLAVAGSGIPYFAMTDKDHKSYGLVPAAVGAYPVIGNSPLSLTAWTHLAVTKAGLTFTFYVNGNLITTFQADQADFKRDDNYDFRIAARMGSGGPDSYFDGAIDDVRLYSVGRPQTAIQGDMSTELDTDAGLPPDLVAYWRFDEGSGGTAGDALGRANGTLVNGPTWVSSGAF